MNRLQLPSGVVFLIVLWHLRFKLSLRDLAEILLLRGLVFSHEAVREWEVKLTPLLADVLRQRTLILPGLRRGAQVPTPGNPAQPARPSGVMNANPAPKLPVAFTK
ncbi:hypothetical protein [Azospirillum endophyticum]